MIKNKNIKINLSNRYNKNTIFNIVLVNNLSSLLDKLKELNVNAGLPSKRGKCSFLYANLHQIYNVYRKSMYLHCASNFNSEF